MLAEGTTFAAYVVHSRIAAGGMGEVYLCRHRVLDRMDAVKVLLPNLAGDAAFRRRFLREALSAARLRHPHVVTVYTADEADGLLYLAMEYVPGHDMATVLQAEGRLDPGRTVRLLAPVADALDTAHRAHLVHRDIKPRNLMLSQPAGEPERLTLVDFGISRLLDDDADLTRTGEIIGTIAYCSPEQLSRGATVTGASDQYSLACVAYECLTGTVPFPRQGQLAMMTAHLTAPPPPATAIRPDLPPAVDPVLARAMAKDPAARYATCAHFVGALANAASPVRATPAAPSSPGVGEASGPEGLLRAVRSGAAVRPRADPAFLRVELGTGPGGPVELGVREGPLALRGDAEDLAGVVRWLLAQAVARHDQRDLCVVCALAPVPGESWVWLNWLPHTRPTTPPLSGSHIATTAEAAADQGQRLRTVVAARGADPTQQWPLVVAVLDERLGITPVAWPQAARSGVHLIYAVRPQTPDPDGVRTLDLASPGWSPTAVDQTYVRDLSDALPD